MKDSMRCLERLHHLRFIGESFKQIVLRIVSQNLAGICQIKPF